MHFNSVKHKFLSIQGFWGKIGNTFPHYNLELTYELYTFLYFPGITLHRLIDSDTELQLYYVYPTDGIHKTSMTNIHNSMLLFKIINASHAYSINRYMNVKHKLLNCNANFCFNKTCLDQKFTLNYTHIQIKNTSFAAKRKKKQA
jgi:hypothetical protein